MKAAQQRFKLLDPVFHFNFLRTEELPELFGLRILLPVAKVIVPAGHGHKPR